MVEKKEEASHSGDLKTIFSKFTGGKPEMDGKTFFKVIFLTS